MNQFNLTTTTTTLSQDKIKEMVTEYCGVVNNRLVILTIVIGLMWLLQPIIYKKLDESNINNKFFSAESLKIIYKWFGMGLVFMLGYSLWLL